MPPKLLLRFRPLYDHLGIGLTEPQRLFLSSWTVTATEDAAAPWTSVLCTWHHICLIWQMMGFQMSERSSQNH